MKYLRPCFNNYSNNTIKLSIIINPHLFFLFLDFIVRWCHVIQAGLQLLIPIHSSTTPVLTSMASVTLPVCYLMRASPIHVPLLT